MIRPESPFAGAGEPRGRHEANRLAWNEGAVTTRGDPGDHRVSRRGQEQPAPGRTRESGRSPGVVPRGDPSPVRIGSGYAFAVERGCGAGGGRRHLRRPHRQRPADQRGAGRVGGLVPLRPSRHAPRAGRYGRPGLHRAGALCWLHDLDGWAAVIARLLKPGGILSVFDDHPVNWLFEMDTETLVATGYELRPQRIIARLAGDLHR